ncbi:hypothetical protein [Microbacterium sp. CFBP 8794]|uniref:hypothetical protein n=1 Tax=Microbacterium sp. CFBP 8794 TaxID=2775269 RepID=UPI001781F34D|nr:hypothetical protein [Microbacterium sp. CFBP 8794]MBD8477563.1 hypothetical protein [Microbacterium sp. CFBP 8794]
MSVVEIHGEGRVVRGVPSSAHRTGLFIGPNGLKGMQGLPARRREALSRPLSAGEYDVPVRLPSRIITIEPGVIIGSSEDDLQRQCDSVNGWGASGERFPLTHNVGGKTRISFVRVIAAEGVNEQRRVGEHFYGRFMVQFHAADPRQYGATEAYPVLAPGGTVKVESRGNYPAHPTVEIPDAPSAWSVTSPAGTFTVSGVPAGGLHRFETRTGRVYRDGVWLQDAGTGPLWAVPNGTEWEHSLSVPGRILLDPTWI